MRVTTDEITDAELALLTDPSTRSVPTGALVDGAWSLPPADTVIHRITIDGHDAGWLALDGDVRLRRLEIPAHLDPVRTWLLDRVIAEHGIIGAVASTADPRMLGPTLHRAAGFRVSSRQLRLTRTAAAPTDIRIRPAVEDDLPTIKTIAAQRPGTQIGFSALPEDLLLLGQLLVAVDAAGAVLSAAEIRPSPDAEHALIRVLREPGHAAASTFAELLTAFAGVAEAQEMIPLLTISSSSQDCLDAATQAGFQDVGHTVDLTFGLRN